MPSSNAPATKAALGKKTYNHNHFLSPIPSDDHAKNALTIPWSSTQLHKQDVSLKCLKENEQERKSKQALKPISLKPIQKSLHVDKPLLNLSESDINNRPLKLAISVRSGNIAQKVKSCKPIPIEKEHLQEDLTLDSTPFYNIDNKTPKPAAEVKRNGFVFMPSPESYTARIGYRSNDGSLDNAAPGVYYARPVNTSYCITDITKNPDGTETSFKRSIKVKIPFKTENSATLLAGEHLPEGYMPVGYSDDLVTYLFRSGLPTYRKPSCYRTIKAQELSTKLENPNAFFLIPVHKEGHNDDPAAYFSSIVGYTIKQQKYLTKEEKEEDMVYAGVDKKVAQWMLSVQGMMHKQQIKYMEAFPEYDLSLHEQRKVMADRYLLEAFYSSVRVVDTVKATFELEIRDMRKKGISVDSAVLSFEKGYETLKNIIYKLVTSSFEDLEFAKEPIMLESNAILKHIQHNEEEQCWSVQITKASKAIMWNFHQKMHLNDLDFTPDFVSAAKELIPTSGKKLKNYMQTSNVAKAFKELDEHAFWDSFFHHSSQYPIPISSTSFDPNKHNAYTYSSIIGYKKVKLNEFSEEKPFPFQQAVYLGTSSQEATWLAGIYGMTFKHQAKYVEMLDAYQFPMRIQKKLVAYKPLLEAFYLSGRIVDVTMATIELKLRQKLEKSTPADQVILAAEAKKKEAFLMKLVTDFILKGPESNCPNNEKFLNTFKEVAKSLKKLKEEDKESLFTNPTLEAGRAIAWKFASLLTIDEQKPFTRLQEAAERFISSGIKIRRDKDEEVQTLEDFVIRSIEYEEHMGDNIKDKFKTSVKQFGNTIKVFFGNKNQ